MLKYLVEIHVPGGFNNEFWRFKPLRGARKTGDSFDTRKAARAAALRRMEKVGQTFYFRIVRMKV